MRPILDKEINPEKFLDFYWLKEELFKFCRDNSIPGSGSKKELTQRVFHYLKTGEVVKPLKKETKIKADSNISLSIESIIPSGYKNDENHRAFFKSVIGENFKFNVAFMNWMKINSGKNYQEAVDEWLRILKEKKAGKKPVIPKQFEYNQYTRDFFDANPKKSREDAITCWKHKKSRPGDNKYEVEDLEVLML